jgi:polysaccharide chain length determinant protein (PEP-CTERM system associated)
MHEQINELFGYLHGLWRYRWSGLLIAWLVAIAGWIYVYSLPNQYNARAVVNIDTSSIMKPLLRGLAVETDQNEELAIMTRVLLSRDNLLTVIRETDMDLGADTPAEKERLVRDLSNSIYLRAPGKGRYGSSTSQIFEIGYESTSPEMAYKVVSTLLNQLIENTLNSDRTGTVMAQEFLEKEIKEYEQRLSKAETRLADFKTKNAGFMPDEKGGYYARIREAEDDVERTKSSLALAQQSYSQLRRQLSGQEPVLGDARSSAATLRKYREQLNDLLTQYTEDHPDVQALRARIAEVKSRTEDQGDSMVGGSDDYVYQELKFQLSKQQIEIGKQQLLLAEQQQKLKKLKESVDTIPQIEAELSRLNRDYEITRERYLSLVERKESARLAQKVEQNSNEINFQVVDAPVVPVLPSGPDRLLLLSAVLAVSLGAGVAWSLLMLLLFPTFVDTKQLRKVIDLPVLGSIGLQMTDEQQKLKLVQLRTFLLSVFVLIASYGSVLLYQEQGSMLVRSVISDIGIVI